MTDTQLTLTPDEREFLSSTLASLLKETRVEEHRTKNLAYREHVIQKDKLIEGLLAKLSAVAKPVPL